MSFYKKLLRVKIILMKNDCFLSIIIPTLNEEKFLPLLLEDIREQSLHNFEVIVVDGKSEDATKQKAHEFDSSLLLTFLESDKRNVSYQRNMGAAKAMGKYLVFLDADSRINKSFISILTQEINDSKAAVYIPTLSPQKSSYQDQVIFKITNMIVRLSQSTPKPLSSSGSMILDKDVFERIGGFKEKLFIAEDHEIVLRARKFKYSIKVLKNVNIAYSLRRIEREGRWTLFRKYLVSTLHLMTKGEIEKKIYDYEMGGSYHLQKRVTRRTKIKNKLLEMRRYLGSTSDK